MSKRKKPTIAVPSEVLETMTSVLRGEMTEESTRKVAGGEERIAVPPKISERIKAAEFLGKQYGLFEHREEASPKTELSGEILRMMEEMHGRSGGGSA